MAALFLLIGPGSSLFASGQREDPVVTARELVAQGQINEAIVLLEGAIRRNPNRLDDAEQLLRQIRTIREQYNELLERLIVHLNTSPEDIETTLDIISEMEELDRFPNERIASQVRYARIIAQLAFDQSVASRIIREARALLAEGRYLDAVERYLSGFILQKPEFEERGYPVLVAQSVNRAIAEIEAEARRFSDRAPPLVAAYEQLSGAVEARAFEGIGSAVGRFVTLHGEGRQAEDRVESAGLTVADVRQTVPSLFPDDPVDWHLLFLQQFTLGPEDAREAEGIVGAMQRMRLNQQRELSDAFAVVTDEVTASAELAFSARRWDDAEALFDDALELAGFAVLMASAGATTPIPPADINRAIEELSSTQLAVYLYHHTAYEAARTAAALAAALSDLDATLARADTDAAGFAVRRTQLAQVAAALDIARDRWEEAVARYPVDTPDLMREAAEENLSITGQRVAAAVEEARTAEIEAVRRIAELRLNTLELGYQQNRTMHASAVQRIEGVETAQEDDGEAAEAVVFRFPAEALADMRASTPQLAALRADAQSLLDSLQQEVGYVRADGEVGDRTTEVRAYLNRLGSLEQAVAETAARAEERVALAAQLRARGNQFATQTEQALARLDVQQARTLWEEARNSFFESLEVQQDPAFRAQADQRVVALGVRLQEAENELIVQAVRRLIDQADTLYRQEQFRQARSVLDEARQTWARTNVDPNPEIERLDRFVTAALTMEGRRTLVQTEPLYPVLSNYLHLAQTDYDRAQNLIAADGLAAARPLLARADQNLSNVTAVRPYNWEARILRLQILRLLESDNFAAIFANRVNEAWARRTEDPTEALVELQALQAINPNFSGLANRIAQIEIELGIRPDPITQAQIARSNQLFQQAQGLSAGGGLAQVRAAINILEEAVTLNPQNNQAKVLLDRLRIGTGGQAAVALSTADEQQFRRAETLFVEGNIAQAFAIVERLLQNENNRLYPPLLNLRQRIASRLGIS
ncbi:MAG: hypothetical protein EA403_03515 [Spirochaetaceae bacterium]|nr:MAG: hypothetical protein EA403_03515 [Spirochaetaceae bacterium]